MTNEEIVKQRLALVHKMFSSTGDEFVKMVLTYCRTGQSALTPELRAKMNTEEFNYKGFVWYKFHAGEPKGKTKKILYLHGGGCVMDSGIAQFLFADYLMEKTGAEIWFPEYPIVPENTGSDALEMIMYLYKEMLKECSGEEIAIGGDSAGGGIAVAAALQIKEEGLAQPNNIFLSSPSCNSVTGPRNKEEEEYQAFLNAHDPIVSTNCFQTIFDLYRGSLDENDWRINPIKGDFKGLAPMIVFAGGYEAMELGIRQFVEEADRQGADIVYICRNREVHDYVVFKSSSVEERNLIVNRLL